jgi:hypothetical protein
MFATLNNCLYTHLKTSIYTKAMTIVRFSALVVKGLLQLIIMVAYNIVSFRKILNIQYYYTREEQSTEEKI